MSAFLFQSKRNVQITCLHASLARVAVNKSSHNIFYLIIITGLKTNKATCTGVPKKNVCIPAV